MSKAIRWCVTLAGMGLALVAAGGAWMIAMPGAPVAAPARVDAAEEARLQAQLLRHISAIAGERNWRRPEALEAAAMYIEGQLKAMGYRIIRQEVPSKIGPVRNIEVRLEGASGQVAKGVVVIGAHYDSAQNTPAANDNGSGVAVLLELARDFSGRRAAPGFGGVNLVFFVNEEPPHFKTSMMGSWVYAAELQARKQKVAAMYSLETMGAYYDAAASQHYPLPGFTLVYPDQGNFLGFISDSGARDAVREAVGAFRATARLPSEGVAAPALLQGIDWSDHWSFRQHGFPGVMVTDTALFRYPHYHMPEDTPDQIDYRRLAKAALGLRDMFSSLYLVPGQGGPRP